MRVLLASASAALLGGCSYTAWPENEGGSSGAMETDAMDADGTRNTIANEISRIDTGLVSIGTGKTVDAGTASTADTGTDPASQNPTRATAMMTGRGGDFPFGYAQFVQQANQVTITLMVSSSNAGVFGINIHEMGSCDPVDPASSGPHFNPTGMMHGEPNTASHHAGDLGNIIIGASTTGTLTFFTTELSLSAGPSSIIGRSIIMHVAKDDLVTQPDGNAGQRLSCGIIRPEY